MDPNCIRALLKGRMELDEKGSAGSIASNASASSDEDDKDKSSMRKRDISFCLKLQYCALCWK